MFYEIENKAGYLIGCYEGNNKAEALLSMLKDAGATDEDVWLTEDGESLEYYDAYAKRRFGINDYYITNYQLTV